MTRYLDSIATRDWTKFYAAEPLSFPGDARQKRLVVGGEACLWGEFVNSHNLVSRMWPRASAVAERLWSPREVTDIDEAKRRMEEMECRMLRRGYSVQPATGPSFCYTARNNEKNRPNKTILDSIHSAIFIDQDLGVLLSFLFLFTLIPCCVLLYRRGSAVLWIKKMPILRRLV